MGTIISCLNPTPLVSVSPNVENTSNLAETEHLKSSTASSSTQRKEVSFQDDEAPNFSPEPFILTPEPTEEKFDGEYRVVKYLGEGAFGTVSAGEATAKHRWFPEGKEVAMKAINDFSSNAGLVKRYVRELRVARKLRNHPAITELYDVKANSKDYNTFTELHIIMEKGECDLKAVVKDTNIIFTERQVRSILKQLFYGIKYMHSANIVHRDLKPENILAWRSANDEWTVKICDFGLARCIEENRCRRLPSSVLENAAAHGLREDLFDHRSYGFSNKPTGHVATCQYRAPEISSRMQTPRDLMCAIDMWSMGCIMGELLQMIHKNNPQGKKRRILIRGRKDGLFNENGKVDYKNTETEQLHKMFELLGVPGDSFRAKVTDREARGLINHLIDKGIRQRNLRDVFPGADDECLEFFLHLLTYDPEERYTVYQALADPYLATVEPFGEEYEQTSEPLFFEFEDIKLDDYKLRCLLVNEIVEVKQILNLESEIETVEENDTTTTAEHIHPGVFGGGANITSIPPRHLHNEENSQSPATRI